MKPTDLDSLWPLVDQFVSANKTLTYRPDYRYAFCDSARKVLSDTDAVIFIAEEKSEIIGLIAGRIIDNGPIIIPDKIGYVGTTVVLSGYRRKGIAKGMWEKLKGWFQSRGIEEVHLYVVPDNDEARGFWQSRGFNLVLERWQKRL
ncbi:MAG: GNAT family N-acetyltransferase [Sedimentisphaerales bacterium]|nr:GNAT family N-acetyltransferase [Sedimentisphaerales bacterium]